VPNLCRKRQLCNGIKSGFLPAKNDETTKSLIFQGRAQGSDMNEARNQTSIRAETVPSHGNGKKPPAVPPELPEHRLRRVEAAAFDYQALMQERDDLDLRLHQAQKKISELEVQVSALQSMINMVESTAKSIDMHAHDRVTKALEQRDEYADRALTLEATLANAYRILHDVIAGEVEHDASAS
jgi:hypothetical protein